MDITLAPTNEGRIQVTVDGAPSHSFDPAPLILDEGRRARAFLQQPEREGARLLAALFPPGSTARQALAELDTQPQPDHIVLVTADPKAQSIPWEYLCDEQGEFLVARHRFVRGLPPDRRRDPPEDVDLSELQILAVPASPLCERDGTPKRQLDVVGDIEGLAEAVRASGAPFFLRAVVPPTLDELHKALAPRRPTLLHFSGHGRAFPDGPTELLFEDEAGVADPVSAGRLLERRGEHLFLVFLSACQSAAAYQRAFSGLAYELVAAGVPYALGMQFSVADPTAARFAGFFYRYLAEGLPVEEAVRQARLALEPHPWALGIPVLYTAHGGEGAHLLRGGAGEVVEGGAEEAGVRLWPPEPDLAELPAAPQFHGYQAEMALLGTHWRDGASVVTVLGEDGIGKTSLAVQAVRRFRWRFPGGVLGLSLDPIPEPPAFLSRLAEWVWGGVPDERWDERRLLHEATDQLRREERLLVLDGYEGAVRAAASDDDDPAAGTVRRLVRRLLGGETRLLLTSREPGDVQGEQTVRLSGLRPEAAAALFRALTPGKGWGWDPETAAYADEDGLRELSGEVGGHPLALQLLAGAYAAGRRSLEDFRLQLAQRLLDARQNYPDRPQHATLAACLAASLEELAPEPRALLPRVALFQAPFLGGIAAAALDDETVPDHLQALSRASLVQPLEVGVEGEEATLYRLHPVVRVFLEPEVAPAELEALRPRFVAAYIYFAAAAHRCFTGPGSRLVRFFLPDLDQALEWAGGRDRAGLAFNLAGLWRDYRLLDEALRLYGEARALFEALGDQQGKSATLHEMAHIYQVRGGLDEALRLYGEALAIREVLGDQQGTSATLAMMGQLLAQRGEHQETLRAFLISLSILTQFQLAPEAAKVAQMIANLRQEVGPARFQVLWAEVAGDEPLPDWLTQP